MEKVTDYSFTSYTDKELEAKFLKFLKKAIPKFAYYCAQDLTNRNDTTGTFNITLTADEIEILATLMVLEWLKPQINSQQLLKEKFGNKEYNLFSSSSLLKELKDLKKETENEANEMITIYHYSTE